jgi:cytochrome c oxidase subunit 3
VSIFHEITKKPWLEEPVDSGGMPHQSAFFAPAGKVGLRVFLCVVTVIFTLTLIAYADRMRFPTWQIMPEPWVLWLNTAFLIIASFAMQRALNSARQNHLNGVRDGLLLGGIFTFAFLTGQVFVWQQLVEMGYYANTNTANAFFYLLTALHGLHLVGGLVAWWRSVFRMWRGSSATDLRLSVELCTKYWHYLLLIWLILFGLLLIS